MPLSGQASLFPGYHVVAQGGLAIYPARPPALRPPLAVIASHSDSSKMADGSPAASRPLEGRWARGFLVPDCRRPLALWQECADDVTGHAVGGGHFFPEARPGKPQTG